MKVVYELIDRILPSYGQHFELELLDDEIEYYEIVPKDNKILLRGSTVSSLCMAFGYYVKHILKLNLSWCGSNLEFGKLVMPEYQKKVIEQKYRVYMNYCTFNYSASWWDMGRWEKEIDFMALNGINMPLCVVGIEAAWYETLKEFGYDDNEARAFLAGPAFLAWQWMTNLEGFGGPLPKTWIDKRLDMGRKIIKRQLELGMTPIQQGFSGFVPRSMMDKFPDANIVLKQKWCGLEATAQLDPTDPLFKKLGAVFMKKQKELFGAYGYYATDPFHEGFPPKEGDEYLNQVGKAIAGLFEDFDKDYCWVMQAWSIRKGIATAVPKDRLLILDLAGTSYNKNGNFWGYNFITGNLHNFGGRTKLHGDLKLLCENQYKKIKSEARNVVGTGLFMEGINQNPVYYDLAFDMLTYGSEMDIDSWLCEYSKRRYGVSDKNASEAWQILLKTAYAPGTNGVEPSSMICARPAVNVKKSGPNEGFVCAYGNKRLAEAYRKLKEIDSCTDGYEYDLVDIMRQILSNYAYSLYQQVSESFLNREIEKFNELSGKFLNLLEDIDDLLSLRKEFSFKQWVEDAKKFAETEEEKELYDYNATALVTIWGPDENPEIFDYSWREWSGLISVYYKERWKKFFALLLGVLKNDEEYVEEGLPNIYGREAWRANSFYNELADWEVNWIRKPKNIPDKQISSKDILDRLQVKYFNQL